MYRVKLQATILGVWFLIIELFMVALMLTARWATSVVDALVAGVLATILFIVPLLWAVHAGVSLMVEGKKELVTKKMCLVAFSVATMIAVFCTAIVFAYLYTTDCQGPECLTGLLVPYLSLIYLLLCVLFSYSSSLYVKKFVENKVFKTIETPPSDGSTLH